MTTDAGSYDFDQFTEQELERLIAQAGIAFDLERAVWRQAGLRPGMRVLDAACGPGVVAAEMARFVGSEGHVLGVDLNETLLATAHAVREKEGVRNLTLQQGNVYEPDPAVKNMDFAYARFLLQHLAHPEKALAGIHQTLKPGGICCLADVDDGWLMLHPPSKAFTRLTELAEQAQKDKGGNRRIGREFGLLLHRAGFREVVVRAQALSSHDLGMETFLNITTGFKLQNLPEEAREEGEALMKQIWQDCAGEQVLGMAAVFIGVGKA